MNHSGTPLLRQGFLRALQPLPAVRRESALSTNAQDPPGVSLSPPTAATFYGIDASCHPDCWETSPPLPRALRIRLRRSLFPGGRDRSRPSALGGG